MVYLVAGGAGGCGTNFLVGLIAHSILKYPLVLEYPEAHGHYFPLFYREKYLNQLDKISVHEYRNLLSADTDMVTAVSPDVDINDVKKYFRDFKVLLISVSEDYFLEVEANHFIKNFALQDSSVFSSYREIYDPTKYPSVNKLIELPETDMKTLVDIHAAGKNKELSFRTTSSFPIEHQHYIKEITYKTLMYDMEATIRFVEDVTGNKRTPELVKSAENYYLANIELRNRYSLLYPK